MDRFIVSATPRDESFVVTLNLKQLVSALKGNFTDKTDYYRQLFNRAYALESEITNAIAQINSDNLEYLSPQWEDAKAVARKAKLEFETAFNQRLRFMNAELAADNRLSNAVNRLSALKNNPPNPNNYPSESDLQVYKQSIVDAQAAVDERQNEVVEAAREAQRFFADLNALESRFNAAAKVELELRNKIDRLQGKPTPSVLGLPTVVG